MSKDTRTTEPLRVLQVFGALNLGGAESRVTELYRAIDRSRVQFDFLVHTDAKGTEDSSNALMSARKPEHFDGILRELGARIFAVPRFHGSNLSAYKKALHRFFTAHSGEWIAVHGHMTSTAAVYLKIAGESGVPLLIAHARSAGTDPGLKGIVTNLMRKPLRATDCPYYRFAVSETAGEAVFGKAAMREGNVQVIPNAVNLEQFAYDPAARERIRVEHNLSEDTFVIGHVGSFRFAKNHEFLLKVFAARKQLHGDAGEVKLLLVGDGERMREMQKLAAAEGIADDVVFAGNQSDIAAYYSAMDALVFPSRYEGMPGTVIEAQAAGLPCLISDAITKEVVLTELVRQLSIQDAPEKWAEEVKTTPGLSAGAVAGREQASATARQQLAAAGFDSKTQAERMTKFYMSGVMEPPSATEEKRTKT